MIVGLSFGKVLEPDKTILLHSVCTASSEPSDPTDGSLPPEPLDSFVTSMFEVNFFGQLYEKNSRNFVGQFIG